MDELALAGALGANHHIVRPGDGLDREDTIERRDAAGDSSAHPTSVWIRTKPSIASSFIVA